MTEQTPEPADTANSPRKLRPVRKPLARTPRARRAATPAPDAAEARPVRRTTRRKSDATPARRASTRRKAVADAASAPAALTPEQAEVIAWYLDDVVKAAQKLGEVLARYGGVGGA